MRSIAIVGMACRYPEARSPQQLWENVLAQRPAFRRIPPVRLRTEDYQGSEDSIRCDTAAVIEDFEFDRAHYRVSAPSYRSTDLSHWLAVAVAGDLLGRLPYAPLSRQSGVFVGNTLTGEFSRANLMRLRWPYVERVLRAALHGNGQREGAEAVLATAEKLYKSSFPATGQESLAGGLSNTIAGRICNLFNLQGGGFTVDGACASSLLAVINACSALEAGPMELALAGGVDLSLDPFELAGFSALGALASRRMSVYDRRPTGFWPGEGCGFVALMREEEALARGIPVLARIRGWGISSDGGGNIMRPEIAGQLLALQRAYQSAGFGIETVAYFEGHGTGTAVGDATELEAISEARRQSGATNSAAIGSIKALIGHTKAAAGMASLIKAVCALNSQIIPPTAGCQNPHSAIDETSGLRCPKRAELWPAGAALHAGVSSMGFGGINAHVVMQGTAALRRARFSPSEQTLSRTWQDAEVFPLSARNGQDLRDAIAQLRAKASDMSFGELGDCSAALAARLDMDAGWRVAVVAATPFELASRLDRLSAIWESETGKTPERMIPVEGIYWSNRSEPGRLGFLFPGQSSPVYRDGGLWSQRFREVDELYRGLRIPSGPSSDTAVAQPAIVAASLAALKVLRGLEIDAEIALGHSLGELLALCWAGGITSETALQLARERGRLMGEAGLAHPGEMLSVAASREQVETISSDLGLVVACHNSTMQTVVSGPARGIQQLQSICLKLGMESTRLPVACAFHSPLMKHAAEEFGRILQKHQVSSPNRRMISSVTASPVNGDVCIRRLLQDQITATVEFADAIQKANTEVDLWLEVGSGSVLSGLASDPGAPVVALEAGGPSLAGLCHAVAASYILRRKPSFDAWFRDRALRPFQFEKNHSYFANPCESVAFLEAEIRPELGPEPGPDSIPAAQVGFQESADCLLQLRQLVARRSELPLDAIHGHHRFLADLHLNSITVTQLVAQAAGELGIPIPVMPINYSTVTVAEAAAALEELQNRATKDGADPESLRSPIAGVDTWIRPFAIKWVRKDLPRQRWKPAPGSWRVLSDSAITSSLAEFRRLLEAESSGLLVCLENPASHAAVPILLSAAREIATGLIKRVVLLQGQGGAEPFFRSLFLEHPGIDTTVITEAARGSTGSERLIAEVLTTAGFREVWFDPAGARLERRIHPLPFPEGRGFPLRPGSRLLVTGGGRGIGLECGLELARCHRLRLAILGRSPIDSDPELRTNLDRIRLAGVEFSYHTADVADAASVRGALQGLRIDGVIHAAGINIPERACRLTEETVRTALAAKCEGLRNILSIVEIGSPQLVVTFGSVIAQTGLDGEAHYALANDWMSRELASWAGQNPECRALHIDWSVWTGTGMGERLGTLDTLVQRGISPISIASGIEGLDRMICGSISGFQPVILTGRLGMLPTLASEEAELPLCRFLESQRVHVPGVELICDTTLSSETDPYFADHELEGQQLFPAVMGLEAMAQVCCALKPNSTLSAIEDIEFARPVLLPPGGPRRIRIAALVRESGAVEVVLRSEETGFQVDHFKARYVFGNTPATASFIDPVIAGDPVPLEPERDLYGSILFHRGRFRRIEQYLDLGALRCRSIVRVDSSGWFGAGVPCTLLLGDPGARDAAIHSIQACIPQGTLLPVKVRRITISDSSNVKSARRVVVASERAHQGAEYIYDLAIAEPDGRIVERWEGLTLRKVATGRVDSSQWPPALLVPYLEWAAAEFSVPVRVAVRASADEGRKERGRKVAEMLVGTEATLYTRSDGKPATGKGTISFSHMEPFTLGVHASDSVSCDLVDVYGVDPAEWRNLLGDDLHSLAGIVGASARESHAQAAARIWAAFECLRKTDADPGTPLTFLPERSNGWTCFGAGSKRVVVGMLRLAGAPGPVAVGILVDQRAAGAGSLVE